MKSVGFNGTLNVWGGGAFIKGVPIRQILAGRFWLGYGMSEGRNAPDECTTILTFSWFPNEL